MAIEARVQSIMEQLQQLLDCKIVCFIPWCSDTSLHHPLLDFWSESPFLADLVTKIPLKDIWLSEHTRSGCDLAVQSGRMQVLNTRQRGSLAAFPVERPAGVLGVLLLADDQPEKFGIGEESLLYRYVSVYADLLEAALWAHCRACVRDYVACVDLTGSRRSAVCTQAETETFLKREFISIVGHELRAPLSVIKGYAGLLQAYGPGSDEPVDQALSPERQRYYLERIMEQTDLLTVLANDLLDFSRIQQGRLAIHPGHVDVGLLCQQVVQLGQLWAEQRGSGKYRLLCRLVTPLPSIWADADRLRQVLMNIIENAIKYSPQGGSIEIEAGLRKERLEQKLADGGQKTASHVYITIRDQGIGISAQHFAHLFQPFERLERPASSQIPGSGLGLYIVRKLIENMEGSITVQSGEGKGTAVTITLPASPTREQTDLAHVAPVAACRASAERYQVSEPVLRKSNHSDILYGRVKK
jgi:signal transduction histidine kinase